MESNKFVSFGVDGIDPGHHIINELRVRDSLCHAIGRNSISYNKVWSQGRSIVTPEAHGIKSVNEEDLFVMEGAACHQASAYKKLVSTKFTVLELGDAIKRD